MLIHGHHAVPFGYDSMHSTNHRCIGTLIKPSESIECIFFSDSQKQDVLCFWESRAENTPIDSGKLMTCADTAIGFVGMHRVYPNCTA